MVSHRATTKKIALKYNETIFNKVKCYTKKYSLSGKERSKEEKRGEKHKICGKQI